MATLTNTTDSVKEPPKISVKCENANFVGTFTITVKANDPVNLISNTDA